VAYQHEQEEINLLQQCDGVFAQQNHFVDGHVDRKHDEFANYLEETVEFFIFFLPISLHNDNLSIKFSFNKFLKIKKDLINFRSFLSNIYINEFAKIINEAGNTSNKSPTHF
jgi:hypothetical protein